MMNKKVSFAEAIPCVSFKNFKSKLSLIVRVNVVVNRIVVVGYGD